MSFSGELTNRSVSDLLTAVAGSKKSGSLRLTHPEGEGVVVFDQGLVAYAGSSSPRETFGSILVAEKHITERQLAQALDLQRAMGKKSLGSILVDLGVLSNEAMRSAVRLQVRRALNDMIDWSGARYEFQQMDVTAGTYVSLPLEEVLPEGAPKSSAAISEISETMIADDPEPAEGKDSGNLQALLGRMADEVRSPEFTGEMVHRVLGLASHVVQRSVLFLCRPDGFCGIGQTGIEISGGNADEAIRNLIIPLDQPSLLREAFELRETVKRPPLRDGADAALIGALGGQFPSEAVAGPTTVDDRVMMILYGDNLPDDQPIGSILELNLMLIQTGMSVENNLLRKRIMHFETLRNFRSKPVEGSSSK